MVQKIDVVTRSFQAGTGAGGKDFDMNQFSEKVAKPIANLLRFTEVVNRIIVVTNGTVGNRLAEIVDTDGTTPTIKAFGEMFPNEIATGKIVVLVCENWGDNPGSGSALNQGISISEGKWVMCWSPEIEMDGFRIATGLAFAEQYGLFSVGFLREGWKDEGREPWNVPQNTAAIWNLEMLKKLDGFAPECNGTGEMVDTGKYGKVDLAGMEDYHLLLRAMKEFGDDFHWGMVCGDNPLEWNTNFESGSARELNHLKKVERQPRVMEAYGGKIFPGEHYNDVWARFLVHQIRDLYK